MRYDIFAEKDKKTKINTVESDEDFVEAMYPGCWLAVEIETPHDIPARPTLVIRSITVDDEHAALAIVSGLADVTCPVGSVLTVLAELVDAENTPLPLSENFRMPLLSRDGREKVLLAAMSDGQVTITVPLRESGVWSVTEEMINSALPESLRMAFSGITIYVVEA